MEDRENSNPPAPAAPTTALSTAGAEKPKLIKNRGPAIAFLVVALVVVFGLVLAVAAMVFGSQKPAAGFVGNWASGAQSLEIRADGEAQGTDGCNGQGSRWHQAGDRIVFEGFMGTLMACMGPGDRMLNGWLGQSAFAELDASNSNRLNFFDQNDSMLGFMVRNGTVEPLPEQPVMTGEPDFPQPVDPMPGFPEPRPMYPDLPDDPREDQGKSAPGISRDPMVKAPRSLESPSPKEGTTP